MNSTGNDRLGTIALALMHAMAASALFACLFMHLGASAAASGWQAKALVVSQFGGAALCAAVLSRPAVAEKLTAAERAHPVMCGVVIGLAVLASFAGVHMACSPLFVKIAFSAVQGIAFWLGFVACVFLADVFELELPMRIMGVSAAAAVLVACAAIAANGYCAAYILLCVLGAAALTAELAEAAGIPPNGECKPLVNIFKYFNPRAPLANVTGGVVFGVSMVFVVVYGALGFDCAVMAAVGMTAAGLVPRKGNDAAVNRAYAVALATAIAMIIVLPIEGKRMASGVILGLNAFYFLRNVGWAYGQCLKLGSLDTAILSRALVSFLSGAAVGSALGALLTMVDAEIAATYSGVAMLFASVVNAVYFLPFLSSPFAREDGLAARNADEHREHAKLAKDLLEGGEGVGGPGESDAPEDGADAGLREKCAVLEKEAGLTEREGDILFLLCKGKTASYIGEELFISRNTAKVHISHVYNKTGIHSQQELMRHVEAIEVD